MLNNLKISHRISIFTVSLYLIISLVSLTIIVFFTRNLVQKSTQQELLQHLESIDHVITNHKELRILPPKIRINEASSLITRLVPNKNNSNLLIFDNSANATTGSSVNFSSYDELKISTNIFNSGIVNLTLDSYPDQVNEIEIQDQSFIYSISPVPISETESLFFVLFYYKNADNMVTEGIRSALIFAYTVGFGVILVFTNLFVRSSLQPIIQLSRDAGRIEIEDREFRLDIPRAEDEIKLLVIRLNEMLERLNDSYLKTKRFTQDASHELRIPLTVIKGNIELIERFGDSDIQIMADSIKAINEEVDNMGKLVEDLLAITRFDNKMADINMKKLDLEAFLDSLMAESAITFRNHKIENIFPKWPENKWIVTDEHLLKQVLRAIIDNAAKYSNTGSKILISGGTKGRWLQICIEDEGIGVAEENLRKITSRFYRTDDSRNRLTGGTGLGLSIAQSAISSIGGRLEISSKLGVGTKICVLIPR